MGIILLILEDILCLLMLCFLGAYYSFLFSHFYKSEGGRWLAYLYFHHLKWLGWYFYSYKYFRATNLWSPPPEQPVYDRPALAEPPIQGYSRRQEASDIWLAPVPLSSEPSPNNLDFATSFRKGKRQCTLPKSTYAIANFT